MASFVVITGSPRATVEFIHEARLAQANGEIVVTDELQGELDEILVLSDGMPTIEELIRLVDEKEVRDIYDIEYEIRPLRAIYRCQVEARNMGHALVLFWKEHPQSNIRAMNQVYQKQGSIRNPGIQKAEPVVVEDEQAEEADEPNVKK